MQLNDVIEGPMSTEDVQSRLQAGQLSTQNLIWGPGVDHWQNIQAWVNGLSGMTMNVEQHDHVPEAWHYAFNGQSRGPMLRDVLVGELKALDTLGDVMVWTKGMKEWAPLFEFHDLLQAVGANKRQFPRADLSGKATMKTAGTTLVAQLLSISEGGFGISLESGLVSGESVSVELSSPQFREPLHAKAEVRYIHQGIVGMKFTHVSVETKGAIIQFIKQNQMRFTIKAA